MVKSDKKFNSTELGLLPDEWQVQSIGELIKSKTIEKPMDGNHGNIHPKSGDFVESGIPFIMANNIQNGKLKLDSCSHISKSQADSLQKGFSKAGDVLLTHKASIGNTALVENIHTEYIMLTPQVTYYRISNHQKLNNAYLKYAFESNYFQNKMRTMSGGGTRAYIGITAQHALKLAIPLSTTEQKEIASVLTDIDSLIETLEQTIIKKNLIKKGTTFELLSGRRRLPGFNKNKKTKKTDLGVIPEDWKIDALEKYINFSNGKAHEEFVSPLGKFKLVTSKFISSNGLLARQTDKCFSPTIQDDVLIVMSDIPNGKALAKCFLVEENDTYTVNQRIGILRTKELNPRWLYFSLNRNPFYLSFNDGVKQTNLRRQDILSCQLLIPQTKAEQESIANTLSEIDADIAALEEKLVKTRNIKDGMLHELLTGRIRLV